MSNKKIKVIVGTPTGFCSGVKRAIAIVKQEIKKSTGRANVYTLGPIVHNAVVVDELKRLGVKTVPRAANGRQSVVVIRSHGCSPKVIVKLEKLGHRVVDATCPYVKRVQNQAVRLKNDGFLTIVIGDKHHPEVKGILGYASPNGIVFHYNAKGPNSKFQIPNSKFIRKVGIIGQTTIPFESFRSAVNSFNIGDYEEIRIINTLCQESLNRQKVCQQISAKVNLMIVVGSRHSANTLSLVDIAQKMGAQVCQIENKSEFENLKLKIKNLKFKKIGIIAGASTPQDTVFKVVQAIKKYTAEFRSSLKNEQNKNSVRSASRWHANKKISQNRGTYANG